MSRLNNTNGTLLTALNNNTPFVYAHLVKFERPVAEGTTNVSVVNGTNGDRFAYITDAGYDITWDDGTTYINASENTVANGNRTYVANKLIKTGSVTESTRVKVDGLNIEIDATAIDTEVTSHFTVTSTEIQGQKGVDLALAGFSVGDKIRFTDNASSELIVTGFKGDGQGGGIGNRNARMTYTTLSGTQATFSNTEKTLTLLSEETNFLTDSTLNTSFVNRQVIVYKAFLYADNPHTLIGEPIKLFEGIITAGNYKESEKGASISWALKSHWGDFEQTRGRITSADFHQALDQNENPQKESTLKKAYAEDYGFAHSEIALNVIATYQDIDIQLKEKKKKKWYGVTKYKYKEVEVEVTRETDLRFDLQARRIPLIYGVVRTKPIPVFADIGASADTNNEVFTAHVLSEGPIQSIMNIYVDDMPLVCIDEADATARSTGSEAVDIKCTGRTDSGNVLTGVTADLSGANLTFQQSDEYYSLLSEDPTSGLFRGHMIRAARQAHEAALAKAFVDPPTSSFQAAQSGIIHEKVIKFTDPEDWYLEFHGGYEDQVASRLISTQANTPGKKFRVQEDYWTPTAGSGIEYWGPNHKLLDTAYAAIKFELSPDQTTLPNIEYVVKGKMIECYNYDGSYEHNNLVTYNGENITNFAEGDTVTIKTRRGFTASSDAGGATYSANDTIAASKTIIEIFYFVDGKGETHWRMRWDLTGQQQDIINEAKDFYVQKGSDTWSMVTYDGTASIDTNLTIAEVLTTTISSPTSSGSADYAATISNQSSNFNAATDQSDAMFRFIDLAEGGGDNELDRYFFSQPLNGSRSSNTLTFNTINSTKAADVTTVDITNKLKLSSNASSTNDFYNGMTIVVSKRLANGNEYSVKKKIEDYDGSTRIATLTDEFLEFRPEVGDKVEIKFTKDIVSETAGNDVRPSNNFAMILLDYISSKTYGPGIDVNTKINLDTFRLAAQMCDTQSDVTVKFASSVSLTAGDVYRYYENSLEKWRGTVKTTASGTSHVFTNVTGKLSNKFNNYAYRNLGDLVYTKNGTDLYKVTTAGVQSSVSNNASTDSSPVLRKVSGSGASTLTMVGHGTGNPVTNYSFYDSDDVKFWKYLGWEEQRQKYVTRHQGNIKLDTNQTVFQIIQGLLEHFNGQLAFVDGRYRLTVESTRTADELDNVFNDTVGGNSPTVANLDIRARYITEDDIIGNIAIKDDGLSKSFNSLSASIADPQLNFDSRSVSFFNSEYLKADRGVVRSTNFTAGGITNYFNARMLVKQTLDKSRFNRQISFTMRPVGLSILPGEVIRIEYDRFGWKSTSPKLFRVETVTLKEDCLIGITAEEYDDSVYIIDPPTVSAFYIDTKQAAVARTPTAPSNVTVTSSGPEGANVITWTASAGLSTTGKYEVWRATSKSGNASTSVVSHATQLDFEPVTNSYTDIGFTNTSDVTYFYWVRAYNEMAQQTTAGNQQRRKKYYSNFNANSNYGGVTDASQVGRAVADGISPINVSMKVASTLAAADSAGNLVLSGGQIPDSGNEIKVFEGTNAIQFDGSGTANGTFNVTISATNVTAGSIADSGSFATINPATGMSQDVGTLVFTISGKKADGTAFTTTRTQSFTKAKQGIQGIQGPQGNSVTGPAGLRTIQGYLYYEKTSNVTVAPSQPSGNTYTISTGLVSGGSGSTEIVTADVTDKWRNSPRTQDATSSSTFWTVRYYGQEGSAGSSTITVSYSSVVKQTSFTGVVVFSGGTLQDDSGNSTTPIEASDLSATSGSTIIDGSRITTGVIKSSNISGTENGSAFTNAGSVFNLSNGVIASKNFRIDSSGNATFGGTLQIGGNNMNMSSTSNFRSSIGAGTSSFNGDYNSLSNRPSLFSGAYGDLSGKPTLFSGSWNDLDDMPSTENGWVTATGLVKPSAVANHLGGANTSSINGNVVLSGTLAADRLSANTTLTNLLYVGSDLVLNSSGKFYTIGKTSYTDSTAGIFIGYSSGNYVLDIGNSSKYIRWNGSSLSIGGDVIVQGNLAANAVTTSSINGSAVTTAKINGSAITSPKIIDEAATLLRFSTDSDQYMTTNQTYYQMIADVWWQLSTEADIHGYVEGKLEGVFTTTTGARSGSYGGYYDLMILMQVGNYVPETGGSQSTTSANLYGSNTSHFTRTNSIGLTNYGGYSISHTLHSRKYGYAQHDIAAGTTTIRIGFGDGQASTPTPISSARNGQYVYCRLFARPYGLTFGSPPRFKADNPSIVFHGYKK